jgi:diaminopimelate decarboxylase
MVAAADRDARFRLTELQARHLADTYGTPLYVIDEAHFRARVREYRNAAEAAWPLSQISFATKANSTAAVVAIAHREGCTIDVASEGELRLARSAGVPAGHCHFHGNNKQATELEFAFQEGIGAVIIDHFGEIELISSLHPPGATQFVLRLAPGVDPITHAKISTGQADTKFGFNIADGSAERALLRSLALGLNLVGVHCHVGSQLLDPEAQRAGGELLARFLVEMKDRHGYQASYLNVGGGLGAKYTDEDRPMPVAEYCRLIAQAVREALAGSGLEPVLGQEPGRSLIAESGVTLYTVGVIKTVPAAKDRDRTYVCVDGGLSDNPRPSLYGSEYTAEAFRGGENRKVTVSGKHCESDTLFSDVELPRRLEVGDLIQVLTTGAYNSSMASNYNRYPRPATVLLREVGDESLIQRRESWDEMLAREIVPEDLC